MQRRDIVMYIIFTLLTCGIFGWVWMAMMTNDLRRGSYNEDFFSGGVCVLLTLITCGFFGLYWAYKMGEMVNVMREKNGLATDSNLPIIYLVVELVMSIVNYALIQNEINKVLE